MADKETSSAAMTEESTAPIAAVLGECVLKLTHSTTYEPPLYLFPELLPQVPQGTPPLPVWDAVADAVDISASSWRVADASQLMAAGAAAAFTGVLSAQTSGDQARTASSARPPQAVVTLTSMVAENRLLAAGVDSSALKAGSFSSAGIITQLATLQTRMGLSDEEGAAIMSNHFINLLAWQKLCEINGGGAGTQASPGHSADSELLNDINATSASSSSSTLPSVLSRKRTRATVEGGGDTTAWLPSPHPWATNAELARDAGRGQQFISACEKNVEDRVDLLRTLAELYQRPWRTLTSQGQQTDFVVPPGTVNVTSPFADNNKNPGALLDPVEDLGWGAGVATAERASLFFGSVRTAHNARFYSVMLSARSASVHTAPQRVPLKQHVTYVGRDEGRQPCAAVAAAAVVPIDVGLRAYTSCPDVLSKLHVAFVLRPVYNHRAEMSPSGEGVLNNGKNNTDAEAPSEDGVTTPERDFAVVHTKTPDHYTLWVVNYGRNGVRIAGKGWVLGEPRQVHTGDVLIIGDEVELCVEEHATAEAAFATAVVHAASSPTSSQVKRERAEDE